MKAFENPKIIPGNRINDEELLRLKGGDSLENFMCCITWVGGGTFCGPTGEFLSPMAAQDECNNTYNPLGASCRCW